MIANHGSLLKLVTLIFVLALTEQVRAETRTWLGADRNIWQHTEYRKTKNDFGGWLLITSDLNWIQKWETSPETVPIFNEANSVKTGEYLAILLLFVNPKTNEANHVSVRCDIKITQPDQSVSINRRGVDCMSGESRGNPNYIRLSPIVINFIGEVSDPLGEWVVEVDMTDVFRRTKLHLKRSFVLEKR